MWLELIKMVVHTIESWPFTIILTIIILRKPLGRICYAFGERIERGSMELRYKEVMLIFPEIREPDGGTWDSDN